SHDSFDEEPYSDSAEAQPAPELLEDEPLHERSAHDDLEDEKPFDDDEPFGAHEHASEPDRTDVDAKLGTDTPPSDPAGEETVEYDVEEAMGSERHAEPEPGHGDDVLEETPEFLQDTPDHDRLWFEQRPPKDFDFDG